MDSEGRFSISAQAVYSRLGTETAPIVVDVRSRLCAEAGIKGLRGNRRTALIIHDRALLASRVAQSLDGRPSDGASALPRNFANCTTAGDRPQDSFFYPGASRGRVVTRDIAYLFLSVGAMLTARKLRLGPDDRLATRRVSCTHLPQRRLEPFGEVYGVAIGPEMHEDQPWLFI